MNPLQRFLVALGNSVSSGEEITSNLSVVPYKVKRRLGPNDRIVYLEESNPFDVGLCRISMGRMFQGGWFSICAVDECVSLLKVSLFNTKHTMNRLRVLHCVHWDQMPSDVREMIPEMISEVFTEGAYPGNIGDVISDQ